MKYSKLILFTFIAVIITVALNYINSPRIDATLSIGNATYIATLLIYSSIAIYIYLIFKNDYSCIETPKSIQTLFKIWLFWNIFNLTRGALLSESYWDFKTLFFSSFPFVMISLTYYLGRDLFMAKTIFLFTIKYLFVYGFLFIPIALVTNDELYSRLMLPICLFILFLPYLKLRWKILVIIVAATSFLLVVDFRSNVIKITFSSLLLFIYYFRNYIKVRILHLLNISLFAAPIVLFILGVTGTYNIYEKMSENEGYTSINTGGEEENLTADTRTLLYVEVLNTATNGGTAKMMIGEGGLEKYNSEIFDPLGNGQNVRYGCEVGILNTLLSNGVIGVTIYFLLLFTVSFIAINNSNNMLAKLLGLFIAFRWTYSFVEEFSNYDLNFYFFWIAVGLVSSANFRNMNDDEIRDYLKLNEK